MSNGILNQPIKPNTKPIDITFGINAISETLIDLNKSKNIKNNKIITLPIVSMWDLNRLCSILLYKIKTLL